MTKQQYVAKQIAIKKSKENKKIKQFTDTFYSHDIITQKINEKRLTNG